MLIEKFWLTVYEIQRQWAKFTTWSDNFAALKTFFFLIISAIAYQVLIEFESLNYAFFIFQVLLIVEAATFLTRGGIMAYFKAPGYLIYLLIAFGLVFIALTPFLAYYPYLRIGKWPLWIFLYFAVGYPLTYLFLSYFCYINYDVYYKQKIGDVLSILMLVCGALSLFYAYIYGAYMHYCNLPFISREVVANVVYFIQASDMSGVERIFQFMLLVNTFCISNFKYGVKIGKIII